MGVFLLAIGGPKGPFVAKKWARNFPGPRPFASSIRGGNFPGTIHRKDHRAGALAKKASFGGAPRGT